MNKSLPFPSTLIKDSFSQPDAIDYYVKSNPQGLFPPEKILFRKYLKKSGKILNIGCGTGREITPLTSEGFDVVGMDFVKEMVFLAREEAKRQNIKLPLVVGDARFLIFKDKTFDNVVMTNAMVQFLTKKERLCVFEDIKRILKDDGILIVHVDNRFVSYDFPYSFPPLIKGAWRMKRIFFDQEKAPLRHTALAKKFQDPKTEDLWILSLDSLTTTVLASLVDGKRILMQRIFGKYYRGLQPYERLVSNKIAIPSCRRIPYYFYRAKELQKEIEDCEMTLLDFQSDWELVFCDRLPSFLRSHTPMTYYVIQKTVTTTERSNEELFDVLPLLKEGISKKGTFIFQIISNSMSPMLSQGDKLYAQSLQDKNLRCGDIIIFENKGQLLAHRIVAFQNSSIITKGDCTPHIDEPLKKVAILAKVTRVDKEDFQINLESFLWKITNVLFAKRSWQETKDFNPVFKRILKGVFTLLMLLLNPFLLKLYWRKSNDISLQKEMIVRLLENQNEISPPLINQRLLEHCRNFNEFLPLVFYNNLGPLIYKRLATMKEISLPHWVLNALEQDFQKSSERTFSLFEDLSSLLKEFQKNRLEVIVLKGAAIAERLYQEASLRPMEDVDLLVKKSDWPQIRRILETLEMTNQENLDLLELESLSRVVMNRHHAYKSLHGTKFEFKFHLFVLDFPDFAETSRYWSKAIRRSIAGVETLTLSDEEHFLYLASRVINLGFRYFLWFYDLKEFFLHHPQLNWSLITKEAKERKVATTIFYTLKVLKEKFFVNDIPHDILVQLEPSRIKQTILDWLFGYQDMGFRKPYDRDRFCIFFIRLYSFFEKFPLTPFGLWRMIRYLFFVISPPLEYLSYRYQIPRWQARLGKGHIIRLDRFFRGLLKV